MIIANWKMQKTYSDAIKWIKDNQSDLIAIKTQTKTSIILCPSFDSLSSIANLIKNTGINLGAQNCASETIGALTGEVSALSLYELGCAYCIIGHSERRTVLRETDQDIQKKFNVLLNNNITPILCIGESLEQKNSNQTLEVLRNQLDSVIQEGIGKTIVIAYEPVWAIGTGIIPATQELKQVISWVKNYISQKNINNCKVIYGGSVNDKNITELLTISQIDGFLLGGASLDIQMLKKIVLLYNKAKYN